MDLFGNIKNASYNVKIDDITYPKDEVKTTKFEITLSEEDGNYGTVVLSIVSTSKDDKISPVEVKIQEDILRCHWIDREDKLPLLLDCFSKFYLKNKSKIKLDDLSCLFHFVVGFFFCFDITYQSFSEYLKIVRKFIASSKSYPEMEITLYDEMINYFSDRGL